MQTPRCRRARQLHVLLAGRQAGRQCRRAGRWAGRQAGWQAGRLAGGSRSTQCQLLNRHQLRQPRSSLLLCHHLHPRVQRHTFTIVTRYLLYYTILAILYVQGVQRYTVTILTRYLLYLTHRECGACPKEKKMVHRRAGPGMIVQQEVMVESKEKCKVAHSE